MARHDRATIDHETCVAYYAGALTAARAARVRQWLERHPEAARRARDDAAHDAAIADFYADVLAAPVPQRLQVGREQPAHRLWQRRAAMAAVVVLAATSGWWLGGRVGVAPDDSFAARVVAAAQQQSGRFAELAPVRTVAGGMAAPDLSLRGYRLVARQRLDHARDMTVFVYRNDDGNTARIYAENDRAHSAAQPDVQSTRGMSLAQWRQGRTRYALVGDLPDSSLQRLAQSARASQLQTRDRQLADADAGDSAREEAASGDRGPLMPADDNGNEVTLQQTLPSTPDLLPAAARMDAESGSM